MDPNSAYGEGKRVGGTPLCNCASGARSRGNHCPMFCFCGAPFATRCSFCHWQLHTRRVKRVNRFISKMVHPSAHIFTLQTLPSGFGQSFSREEACHPYNVGSDKAITIGDLAEELVSALGDGHKKLMKGINGHGFEVCPFDHSFSKRTRTSRMGKKKRSATKDVFLVAAQLIQAIKYSFPRY